MCRRWWKRLSVTDFKAVFTVSCLEELCVSLDYGNAKSISAFQINVWENNKALSAKCLCSAGRTINLVFFLLQLQPGIEVLALHHGTFVSLLYSVAHFVLCFLPPPVQEWAVTWWPSRPVGSQPICTFGASLGCFLTRWGNTGPIPASPSSPQVAL